MHAANQADTVAGCDGAGAHGGEVSHGGGLLWGPRLSGHGRDVRARAARLGAPYCATLGEGFVVQPKRWVVERTFAWLGHFRRLAKDVEILTGTAENMIRIAMLKITLAKC